jgi:hypothetical protein
MSKTGILFGIAALAVGIFLTQKYVAPSLTAYLAKL